MTWNSTTSYPPGVYTLQLTYSGNVYYETDHEFYYWRTGNASFLMTNYGTIFKTAFPSDNCQHYCWQSFFGPSGTDSVPHQQFEFQIRNDVLYAHALNVQHLNQVGLIASFVDSKGAYNIPFLDNTATSPLSFVPMKLVDQAVPEFASTTLPLIFSVLAVIVIAKKVKRSSSDTET